MSCPINSSVSLAPRSGLGRQKASGVSMVAESIMEGSLGVSNQFLRGRLPCFTQANAWDMANPHSTSSWCWWHILVAASVADETGDMVVGAATDAAFVWSFPGVH